MECCQNGLAGLRGALIATRRRDVVSQDLTPRTRHHAPTRPAPASLSLRALRVAPGFDQTDAFFEALRQTADRAGAPRWDGRLGFGMIDAEAAFNAWS